MNEKLDRSGDCTLCGDNGLDFMLDETSIWPTRQPSSPKVTLPFITIDPPPVDLAKSCAPSIHLHRDSRGLVENCIKACLPALCCLVNNEEAQEGLLSTLGLLAMGDDQASSAYLSTIKDCYSGDDIIVCDAYNEWCATLYSLEFVLESLPRHFFDTCYRKEEHEDIIIATSRAFNPVTADGDCGEICSPLACCYESGQESNNHVIRKRVRQHRHYTDGESILETESRRLVEEYECQHFRAQEPLSAQICDAYSPFCNPTDHLLDSDLAYPSSEPSGTPTQMQSLKPSVQSSKQPSILPSRSDPPAFQPTTTKNPTVSLPPTSIPSAMPTSFPSIQQTSSPTFQPTATKNSSVSPTNENNGSSSFTPTNSPTFQSSTTNFTSESDTTQPSASLYLTSNSSSPSSMENNFLTQQPSSSETPTVESRNITLNSTSSYSYQLSISLSAQPSVSPSSYTNTSSMEPILET